MGRSRPLAVLGSGAAVLLLAVSPARAAEARRFAGLVPGQFQVQTQRIPVRVVLVGFGDEVDTSAIADSLPATYKPVVRYPLFYGRTGRDLGLEYQFHYRFERRNSAFAGQLFAYLKSAGTPGPITAFQEAYNEQGNGVPGQRRPIREVRGPVLYIDAAKAEKWLVDHDADAADRGYTLYFINWYGRSDFQFHVYTKTDEPDPDTGYNFGVQRATRKMVSWGGTHSRNWFYDFSAGPESWGGSYDINDADLDGDGSADYRIPPIWEYDAAGYRAPERLSHDMGLLARFVGIDLLFTTSPLYDPLVTSPEPGGRKVAHVAMLENEPGVSGLDWFHGAVAEREWRAFQPYYAWKVGVTDSGPRGSRRPEGPRDLQRQLQRQGLLDAFRRHLRRALLLLRREPPPLHPEIRTARLRGRGLLLQHHRRVAGQHVRAPRLRRRQLGGRHPDLRVRVRQRGRTASSATD